MLTIDRMRGKYRIGGDLPARVALARRLDRIAAERLAAALEPAAGSEDPEAPHVVIGALALRIRVTGAAALQGGDPVAEDELLRVWAAALGRELQRLLAEGGPDVARFASRAEFLAAWAGQRLAGGRDWRFDEFRVLDDLPAGRAIALGLSQAPEWIVAVVAALRTAGRWEAVRAAFGAEDVALLWRALCGALPPEPGEGVPLAPGLIRQLAGQAAPGAVLFDPLDPVARARRALDWLLHLWAPARLPPEQAAPLALACAAVEALRIACPELRLWQAPDAPEAMEELAAVPPALGGPARRIAALRDAPGSLAAILGLMVPAASARPVSAAQTLRSSFAGLALLLAPLAAAGLAAPLGAEGRHRLLAAAVRPGLRPLAGLDPALRLLSGAPDPAPVAPAWPAATEPLRGLAASHGIGPETGALGLVLDLLAQGIRGMERASAEYLAQQFLERPGWLQLSPREIVVRLDPLPMGILLRMSGRTGPQLLAPWFGPRALRLEVADV